MKRELLVDGMKVGTRTNKNETFIGHYMQDFKHENVPDTHIAVKLLDGDIMFFNLSKTLGVL